MIKRFRLPKSSLSVESLVDLVSRSSFDGIHYLRQRKNFHGFAIDERSEDQVNMIRHDNRHLEVELVTVVVETACKHDGPHASGKNPPPISAEGNKMLPIVDLQMRQLPTIKRLRHKGYVGTAAFGCPRSEAPLVLILGLLRLCV